VPEAVTVFVLLLLRRERYSTVEHEVAAISRGVAGVHSGRNRGDRSQYERPGPNLKTQLKYQHVIRMFFNFLLLYNLFDQRWSSPVLSAAVWADIAWHFYTYSGRRSGVSDSTLESYLRMLSHVLIFVAGGCSAAMSVACLQHACQRDIIQRVVDVHCTFFPACRTVRNTKSAWDNVLVDAGLQLLLQWGSFGHCYLKHPAWPAFARMTLSMLNYLGWRPMSLTRDRVDAQDDRWRNHPILPFGLCELAWQHGKAVSVQVFGLRTKFNRNPRPEQGRDGSLSDRIIMDGKLTHADAVDVCPVLAWLVWAIVCGAFGWEPLRVVGGYVVGGAAAIAVDAVSCDMIDALVQSIFTVMPSGVLQHMNRAAVFGGSLLGYVGQACTDVVSNVPHVVGVRLGLNPSKCSAVCGRKTLATATVMHPETTDLDATRALGHNNPRLTTTARYADASARTADTRSILTGAPVRALPATVTLGRSRNLNPDIAAAQRCGKEAAAAVARNMSRGQRSSPVASHVRLNAYKSAFRQEMQRQYDAQASLPRAGDTGSRLESFFFQPIDCSGMSQAEFVSWQVKLALGKLQRPALRYLGAV
jgi:hypothetical protein